MRRAATRARRSGRYANAAGPWSRTRKREEEEQEEKGGGETEDEDDDEDDEEDVHVLGCCSAPTLIKFAWHVAFGVVDPARVHWFNCI